MRSSGISTVEEDRYLSEGLSVYPNPVSNSLKVDLGNLAESDSAYLSVYTLEGVQVFKIEFRKKIDISGLSSGCYILTYSNGKVSQSTKFFKTD